MTPSDQGTVALGISASSREFSIALRFSDGSIQTSDAADAKGASDLAAVVAEMFDKYDVRPSEMGELRLDLGPGSYTGLRVAVTFARVAAHFREIPVRTTTSLQLMALAAWNSMTVPADVTIRPVLDARRNRFHHAAVRLSESARLISEPRATELAELFESIQPGETLLAAEPLHATLSERTSGDDLSIVEPLHFDAGLLFDSRLALREANVDELEPLYLMGSYAE